MICVYVKPSVGARRCAGDPRTMFAVTGMSFAVCGFKYYVFSATDIIAFLGIPHVHHYAIVVLLCPASRWVVIVWCHCRCHHPCQRCAHQSSIEPSDPLPYRPLPCVDTRHTTDPAFTPLYIATRRFPCPTVVISACCPQPCCYEPHLHRPIELSGALVPIGHHHSVCISPSMKAHACSWRVVAFGSEK